MGPVAIVVVLPLAQLLVEQMNVVGDAVLVQELIELLIVNAVRPLHLAVEVRRARTDIRVADVERIEMPVEVGLKLGPVVPCSTEAKTGQALL